MAVCRASEGNISNLGNDILTDILSRLPPKRLIMCKVVSKNFCLLVSTLIHSPTRARPFSGMNTGLFILLIVYRGYHEFFQYLPNVEIGVNNVINDVLSFLPCHPNTRVHDIRDGFLLCSSYHRYEYYVCNPVTRQWVHLPRPPERYGNCNIAALVLDPKPSDVLFCHYKVVEFATTYGRTPHSDLDIIIDPSKGSEEKILMDLNVCVYSSRTGQWVESNACLKDIKFFLSEKKSSVFVNGALFLPAITSQILMFDVKEEYIKVLELPTDLPISWCLGESEGCLTCVCHYGSEIGVWKIDGVDSKWALMRKIDLNDFGLPDDWKDPQDPLDIQAVHPNLDVVFLRSHQDFFRCDINSRESKKLFSSYYNALSQINLLSECPCSLADAHRRIQQ